MAEAASGDRPGRGAVRDEVPSGSRRACEHRTRPAEAAIEAAVQACAQATPASRNVRSVRTASCRALLDAVDDRMPAGGVRHPAHVGRVDRVGSAASITPCRSVMKPPLSTSGEQRGRPSRRAARRSQRSGVRPCLRRHRGLALGRVLLHDVDPVVEHDAALRCPRPRPTVPLARSRRGSPRS